MYAALAATKLPRPIPPTIMFSPGPVVGSVIPLVATAGAATGAGCETTVDAVVAVVDGAAAA